MDGLGKFVHQLNVPGKGKVMKYGLYTSRGVQQCDTAEYMKRCFHMPPNPLKRCEGSHGYEAGDVIKLCCYIFTLCCYPMDLVGWLSRVFLRVLSVWEHSSCTPKKFKC
jgi:hypothetical protein